MPSAPPTRTSALRPVSHCPDWCLGRPITDINNRSSGPGNSNQLCGGSNALSIIYRGGVGATP